MRRMHNGKPKIQYVQCHFEGNTKSALIYHTVNAHKGKISKFSENQTSFQSSMQNQIVCDKCGMGFKYKYQRNIHIQMGFKYKYQRNIQIQMGCLNLIATNVIINEQLRNLLKVT